MSKTGKIIAALVLVLLAAGALFAWKALSPEAVSGTKTIEIAVIHGDGSEKDFTVQTEAESLRQAADELQLLAGDDGEFGLYIHAVDGETADESLQQWWCITKSGEMLMTGVDDTMISNGDRYEFTLTTGW